jgi:hypothetical protein
MPGWDQEAPTRPVTPAHEGETSRTSREWCKRCGDRAAARCVGCGEPFCKACVDPRTKNDAALTCRPCARAGTARSNEGSVALLEAAVERCLARLQAREPTPIVRAMRREAIDCQAVIDAWSVKAPDGEARDAMRARVLALHAKIEGDGN